MVGKGGSVVVPRRTSCCCRFAASVVAGGLPQKSSRTEQLRMLGSTQGLSQVSCAALVSNILGWAELPLALWLLEVRSPSPIEQRECSLGSEPYEPLLMNASGARQSM